MAQRGQYPIRVGAALYCLSLVASCSGEVGGQTGAALNRRIAQIEASESQWQTPTATLADEAKSLGFAGDLAQEVDRALKVDLPMAVLRLQAVAQQKRSGPTAAQKAWLDAQILALTPRALLVLDSAWGNAKSVLDLRGMIISSAVRIRIGKDTIPSASDSASAVLKKILAGSRGRVYWSVANVTGTDIGGSYSERVGMGTASVFAKEGQKLLRVSAVLRNTASGSDLPHVLGVFDGLKSVGADIQPTTTIDGVEQPLVTAGPHRWLDDTLIFLVTPSGELIKCGFVVQGSGFRGVLEMHISGVGIITPPKPVKPMTDFRFEGIFPIPTETQDFKLLVLGASPASVPVVPGTRD